MRRNIFNIKVLNLKIKDKFTLVSNWTSYANFYLKSKPFKLIFPLSCFKHEL